MRLKENHPALSAARTIHTKMIRDVADMSSLLKPSSGNKKIGAGKSAVTRGRWKGMAMYSLTLEERATCPRSCAMWRSCYGNNMLFGHRAKHGPALTARLARELDSLSEKHPAGFVVRLHILGDFYSVPYVNFWSRMLAKHPGLRIFGYTHRLPDSRIGRAIADNLQNERAVIRFSNPRGRAADTVAPGLAAYTGDRAPADALTCPEQTGKTESCLTCGLCWSTPRAIQFIEH